MTSPTAVTSAAALASVTPAIPSIQRRVYEFIFNQGQNGATADEIEAALGIPGNTIRPRLRELEFDEQKIILTEVTRLTRRGRKACVYIARDLPN